MSGVRAYRGVTLMETLALVIVTAIAVPPLVSVATSGSRAVMDERSAVRAGWLASAVIEQVIADAGSGLASRGIVAMGDPAYLEGPSEGLRARLVSVASVYADRGISYEVTISAPVDATGAGVDASQQTATRLVTVEVVYTDESGTTRRAPVRTVVGHP